MAAPSQQKFFEVIKPHSNYEFIGNQRYWIGISVVLTLLTLIIVPAGFSLADGVEKRLGPWLRHRILTYRPGDAHGDTAEPYPAE